MGPSRRGGRAVASNVAVGPQDRSECQNMLLALGLLRPERVKKKAKRSPMSGAKATPSGVVAQSNVEGGTG